MLEYVHECGKGVSGVVGGAEVAAAMVRLKAEVLFPSFRELAANSLQFYAAFVAVSFAMKEDRPSCERVPRSYA
jgi:hypothetical protein